MTIRLFALSLLALAGCGAGAASAGASINSDGTVSADAEASVDTPAGTLGAGASASSGGSATATTTSAGRTVSRTAYATPTPGYATTGSCAEQWVHMPLVINFPSGGSVIDTQNRAVLQEMVRSAQTRDDLVAVRVEGHTDHCGREVNNMALSQQRAHSVANELVSMGVPRERVQIVGYGSTQPRANERCDRGANQALSRNMNRRVEFTLLVCR